MAHVVSHFAISEQLLVSKLTVSDWNTQPFSDNQKEQSHSLCLDYLQLI